MKSVLEAQHGRRVRAADLLRRQCAHSLRTGASAESLASLGFLEPNHRDIQECLAVVELDSKPKKNPYHLYKGSEVLQSRKP